MNIEREGITTTYVSDVLKLSFLFGGIIYDAFFKGITIRYVYKFKD